MPLYNNIVETPNHLPYLEFQFMVGQLFMKGLHDRYDITKQGPVTQKDILSFLQKRFFRRCDTSDLNQLYAVYLAAFES